MYVESLLSDRSPLPDADPGTVAEAPHGVLVGLPTVGPPPADGGPLGDGPSARWPTVCGPVLHR
ncbi:hypothetical protein ACFC09_30605 [Streptomyces sp. NPDC056161]|uniref:hypothetical protein n=1 Tax=Streptomyces sp. NPDC056161 TaxID=3345732 RepID=UPI0035D7BB9E